MRLVTMIVDVLGIPIEIWSMANRFIRLLFQIVCLPLQY